MQSGPMHLPQASTPASLTEMVANNQPIQHAGQKRQLLIDIESSGADQLVVDDVENGSIQVQQQQQQGANNDLIGYYFGSISRETAEWILKTHGNKLDGAYLLRSSGPKDDFVLSLMMVAGDAPAPAQNQVSVCNTPASKLEVLHYKIVETEDSFVALHGQVGDEKFATIDELIERAQGVATKPKWPIQRQSLESQILPPTFWGLTVDQIRLAILIKAKQWGFPLSIFHQPTTTTTAAAAATTTTATTLSASGQQLNQIDQQTPSGAILSATNHVDQLDNGGTGTNININNQPATVTTLDNETIRTLIYKSLHEFQPWFHGRISRDEAERRISDEAANQHRDGRFLVRERDNFSYAMCISHKRTTKHYRIDVLSTGELAIQDGRKFTSLMALVSHYTIMSDGLWCALTEPCPRPILQANSSGNSNKLQHGNRSDLPAPNLNFQQAINGFHQSRFMAGQQVAANHIQQLNNNNNIYCIPPPSDSRILDGQSSSNSNSYNQHSNKTSYHQSVSESASFSLRSRNHQHDHNHQQHQHQHQHQHQQHQQQRYNKEVARQNSQALMCPGQNTAVLSIKAPIKEWLHTINHKWTQMIASKTNQPSLNAFLFGASNPLNNHCKHKNHNHHHHNQHNNYHRRGCKNERCNKHHHRTDQGRGASAKHGHHKQLPPTQNLNRLQQHHHHHHQAPILNPACSCCATAAATQNGSIDGPLQDGTMNGRMAMNSGGPLLRALPANSLALQQLNNSQISTARNSSLDQTKALLSSLPQNAGFMLDGQSFIGSPLFHVKQPNVQTSANNEPARPTGSNGSSGSGNNGAGEGATTNGVMKLISPAQSITANLANGNPSNPYALNTDIYGSQATTAAVNDQLLTSSSSSSGNNQNKDLQQHHLRKSSMDMMMKQQQQQQQLTYRNAARHAFQNATVRPPPVSNQQHVNNGASKVVAPGYEGQSVGMAQQISTAQSYTDAYLNDQRRLARAQAANQQQQQQSRAAGPILCGQHAGPAYRYSNCTNIEDSAFRPCLHSAQMMNGGVAFTARAVDDLHLPTASTQLAGPAALTKFVQFQDGQCLRTHRDAKSIQMAYLLSRQEALNVLNERSAARSNNGQNHSIAHHQHQHNNAPFQNNMINNSRSNLDGVNSNLPTTSTNNNFQSQNGRNQAIVDEQKNDFDLIDCDGSGFQFKYDPKLIKSSSIETLCGINDCEDKITEDLSNFRTNSELLSALQPYWSAGNNQSYTSEAIGNLDMPFYCPLVPVPASTQQQQQQQQADHQVHTDSPMDGTGAQVSRQSDSSDKSSCDLASLLQAPITATTIAENMHAHSKMDESWNRKHDLDELTTSLLAELTASLKAQVDLKNKRSGLCNSLVPDDQCNTGLSGMKQTDAPTEHVASGGATTQAASELNPLELINEFDTLICNGAKDHTGNGNSNTNR